MDPEQIYQEVLQEEQQKGSAGPVAEGRAKAARVRAEHGSPHPKEPKWWPGAQPHLEGGEAATEAPAETAEEPVVEEPAAEAPAAEEAPAPAEPVAAEPEPAPAVEAPAAEAPVAAPAAAPAEQPAAAPAPAAVATAPAPTHAPTTGVSPGSATGTRLRPEDAVTNEAQFTGQQAMYERRRLIDEVIRTGVPAAAAAERERSSSGALAILYLLIPILVIAFVVANRDSGGEAASDTGESSETQGEPGGDGNTIVASGIAFETEEITTEAGAEVTGTLVNEDTVAHNIAFYNSEDETSDPSSAFYTSPDAAGGAEAEFSFDAPDEAGDYPFVCDYHPTTMTGTLVVEAGGGGGGGGGG